MGLLSSSGSTRMSKAFMAFIRKAHIVGAMLYVAGIGLIIALMWPGFNQHTYFSENALLPGLVDEEFNDKTSLISYWTLLSQSNSTRGDVVPVQLLVDLFHNMRVETYVQNFTLEEPLRPKEVLQGQNVYGIVRAARSSSTEAIVVLCSNSRKHIPGIAVLLALSKFSRSRVYWAKDIIFLFPEMGEVGTQAWLSAYHRTSLQSLKVEELPARGGAIQAAFAIEMTDMEVSYANLKYQMVNGQLPNLDLFNLAKRMVEKFNLEPMIHRTKRPTYAFTLKGYKQFLRAATVGLLSQVLGRPNGLHSVFGQYGVEAVTVELFSRKSQRRVSTDPVRILEGMLRSINNLLERFHQSYFFYVLSSCDRFVSIGLYMPSVGLITLALLLLAAKLWAVVNEELYPDNANDTEADAVKSSTKTLDSSMLGSLPYLLLAHSCGLAFLYLPMVVRRFPVYEEADQNLFGGVFALLLTMLFIPAFFIRGKLGFSDGSLPTDFRILRCFALLELALITGVSSVVNFALGLFLAITWTPVCMMIAPQCGRLRRVLNAFLLLLINPLVMAYIALLIHSVATAKSEFVSLDTFEKLYDCYLQLQSGLSSIVFDSFIFRSWFYAFISLCIAPTWFMFWTLAQV